MHTLQKDLKMTNNLDSGEDNIGCTPVVNEKMPSFSVGTVPLGDHDQDWFVVMTKLANKSLRANVANVLSFYVRRRKEEYREILEYTAKKYGITPEECFERLKNGEDLDSLAKGK